VNVDRRVGAMKGLDVAVVGAGIAGIEAALTIADHGIRVHLIEIEPSIGGHMAQLDTTFPTNDSSMCLLSSKMAGVERHPMIVLHTMAEVSAVSGDAFDYTVRLATHPRYVDASACTGCGACSEACPVEVYNRYDAGIGVRKAIYVPHPRAIPHIAVRDPEHCIDCGLCYDTCTAGAIARNEPERESYLQVAGIVIATGYEPYDPAEKKAFRYLDYPDVITSLEFERMLAADGPTSGEIRRLSDGKRPDSIVFISCVGSREKKEGRNYCSCVCCMYTAKNARRVGEKYPDVQVTVMRSDIRAYGKGYQEYFKSAKKDAGVKYIRGMPGSVERGRDGRMRIVVEKIKKETPVTEMVTLEPDLVVLSVGMRPSPRTERLAAMLQIPLDPFGFLDAENRFSCPVETVRKGIYIAGAAVSPKDISDCVVQGEAAAMKVFLDAVSAAAGRRP